MRKSIAYLLIISLLLHDAYGAQSTCGSLVTYRQFSAILDSAPRCLRQGCNQNSDLTSISSECLPGAPCYSVWKLFADNFQQDWCSSCKSDVSCRISGWPILNATTSCEIVPNDWLFYVDGGCCVTGNETFELASWVGSMCNQTDWRQQFKPYNGMARDDWKEWISPWNWTIQTKNTTSDVQNLDKRVVCKRPSTYLALFLSDSITTLVVTCISAAFKSYLINQRRRGTFDWLLSNSTPNRGQWSIIQTVSLGLLTGSIQVGLNFVNAYRVHRYPGYRHVPLFRLGLLYCARPSLNWFPVAIAMLQKFELRRVASSDAYAIWLNVAWTAAISEVLMQGFASVSLFTAVNVGRRRHLYFARNLHQYWDGRPVVRVYVGALFWVIFCVFIITFWLVVCFLFLQVMLLIQAYHVHFPPAPNDPTQPGLLNRIGRNIWTRPRRYIGESRFWRTITTPFGDLHSLFWSSPVGIWFGENVTSPIGRSRNWVTSTVKRGKYAPWVWIPEKRQQWREKHPVDPASEITFSDRARQWNDETKEITLGFVLALGIFNYAAQWLFWDGYVKSRSFGFCPPDTEILAIVTIWNSSSLIAILITFFFN